MSPGPIQIAEECTSRYADIEKTFLQADTQWRTLEEQLEVAEETFLDDRTSSFQQWFGMKKDELKSWAQGSLRQFLRSRLHELLLVPLEDQMLAKAGLELPTIIDGSMINSFGQQAPKSSNQLLLLLVAHLRQEVRPIMDVAVKKEEELQRKIRKTEKDERAKGIVALGMQDTKKVAALKRQRPEIWEDTQRALEPLQMAAKKVRDFMKDDCSPEKTCSYAAVVPVIVLRAICDFYLKRSLSGYEQIREWWAATKAKLQADGELWRRLLKQEDVILPRIDSCLDEIGSRRRSYLVYATFGGTTTEVRDFLTSPACLKQAAMTGIPPALEDTVRLLVHEVSHMHQRLRALKDGALWRIVESSRLIFLELKQEDEAQVSSPWCAAPLEIGEEELQKALLMHKHDPSADTDVVDAAVVVLRRIEAMASICGEIQSFLNETLDGRGVAGACAVFQDMVGHLSALEEDLLAVLDDPEPANVQAWLKTFTSTFAGRSLGRRLDREMGPLPFKADAALKAAERRVRTRLLSLCRGLQAFSMDSLLRAKVVAPLLATVPVSVEDFAAARAPHSADNGGDYSDCSLSAASYVRTELNIDMPTTPRGTSLSTRRGQPMHFQPNSRRVEDAEVPLAEEMGGAVPSSSRPEGESRPPRPIGGAVPAFLQPWRPDTPSTVTPEDLDTAFAAAVAGYPARPFVGPAPKLVEGKLIPARPGSASVRLPPLRPGSSPKSGEAGSF